MLDKLHCLNKNNITKRKESYKKYIHKLVLLNKKICQRRKKKCNLLNFAKEKKLQNLQIFLQSNFASFIYTYSHKMHKMYIENSSLILQISNYKDAIKLQPIKAGVYFAFTREKMMNDSLQISFEIPAYVHLFNNIFSCNMFLFIHLLFFCIFI